MNEVAAPLTKRDVARLASVPVVPPEALSDMQKPNQGLCGYGRVEISAPGRACSCMAVDARGQRVDGPGTRGTTCWTRDSKPGQPKNVPPVPYTVM